MRMYDYTQDFLTLARLLEEGEIELETYQETLQSMEGDSTEKANNLGKMISNFEAQANMLKAEEDRLKKKRKTLENKIEWLTSSLEAFYNAVDPNREKPYRVGMYELKYKKLPDMVDVKNEKALALDYKERVVTIKPDKRKIKKALEDGISVRGAELITGRTKFEVKK